MNEVSVQQFDAVMCTKFIIKNSSFCKLRTEVIKLLKSKLMRKNPFGKLRKEKNLQDFKNYGAVDKVLFVVALLN